MSEENEYPGTITIAPEVLVTIVQQTALKDENVQALAAKPPRRSRVKGPRATAAGVEVVQGKDGVYAVIHIIAQPGANIMHLAESLQSEIVHALEQMTELPAARVSVFVDDVSTAGVG